MSCLGELILSDTVDDRERGPYTIIESTAIDGSMADVYGEFPETSAENAKAIVDGMNERESLRQILVDICNIVGACTADVSLTFLAHLPGEVKAQLEKLTTQHQTAVRAAAAALAEKDALLEVVTRLQTELTKWRGEAS